MSSSSKLPGWKDMPPGADIIEPGSAVATRTGQWRSERPESKSEKCIKCGVCGLFCPEGCIDFQEDGTPLVDFEYCKGCGICARECFTGCIIMVMEKE
ncbi:MAG: 4Fe-4S binding protein [Pseudomonadota bacterium]